MDAPAIHACLDRNAAEAVRHFGTHAPAAVLRDERGTLFVVAACRFTGAFHTAAMRCDPTVPARSALAATQAFADEHDRDLVLWAAEHGDADLARAARAAGCAERAAVVGMAIEAPPATAAPTPVGVELVEVTDGDGVEAFASIHCALFGAPEPVAHFASPGALLASNATAVVARHDGRPVACALTIASGAEAGIYWVATVPGARRMGLGALVTTAAIEAGFRLGARVVVLQATAAAESLYRALGFTAHTRYRRYLVTSRRHHR